MVRGSTDDSIAQLAVSKADHESGQALRFEKSGGGLGHEIRNAVMPLVLLLDVLEDQSIDRDAASAAQRQESIEYLQRLANGLLLASTAETTASEPVAVSLQQWWSDVGALVRMPLGRSCTVHVSLPETPIVVIAQPPVLAQVLLHLMVSTRLAMPVDSMHTVNIVARQTLRSVSLTVGDGAGSAEASAKARDAAMAPHWGMSLARTLLQRSGSELSGYSAIGFGTHLTVRLLVAPTSATPQNRSDGKVRSTARRPSQSPDRVAEEPKALPTAASVETMSVLIVDDNTALTGALAMRLAMDGGFECFPAMHELCSAVEQITAQQPAIVLLDLNLPGTEGPLDVIRGLRTSAPDTRVIVLTGNPSEEAVRGARDAGAAGFVAKGVAPDRLLNVMRRATTDGFLLELDG